MELLNIKSAIAGFGLATALLGAQHVGAVTIDTVDSLDLVTGDPDLNSSFLNFTYTDAATDNFTISSEYNWAMNLIVDGVDSNIVGGMFSISGTVTGTDADLTLSVTSDTDGFFSASLEQMSFISGANDFQFIFGSAIGSGTLFDTFGENLGVTFSDSALSGFGFDSGQYGLIVDASGESDTFAVPVSGTLSLSLLALTGLVAHRRRMSRTLVQR